MIIRACVHLVIGWLLLSGCAGLEAKRAVDADNVFVSSSRPACRIKIDDAFRYFGDKKETGQASGQLSGEALTGVQAEVYGFGKPSESKWVTIRIHRITSDRWHFNPGFYRFSVSYEAGKKTRAGKNYEYCVFPFKNPESGAVYLVNAMGRLSGAANAIKLQVIYEMKVDGEWGPLASLSEEQRKTLHAFIAASERDVDILE